MSKKLVAFSAGRRNGNTETLIKEALMGAEEMGVEVELIRLNECNLQPCKGCMFGKCFENGPYTCIIKDDCAWLAEEFLDSDGYILGAPVWSLSPPGIVTDFRDRVFGPKMDVALWENMGIPPFAKGRLKYRPAGLISVGGAVTKNWTSLNMATLFTTTFSAHTQVVDYMDINHIGDIGAATLHDDLIARAHELGRNVANAMLHPELNNEWQHPYEGECCPGCRQNLMIFKPGNDYMECAICGTTARITLADGKITLDFDRGGKDDRMTVDGLRTHQAEIMESHVRDFAPFEEIAKERMKKYRDYTACIAKPPKQ